MDQLRADNAQLTQQVAALTAQVQQLMAAAAAPPPAPPPPPVVVPVPAPRPKCPAAIPDKFDGTPAQFAAFLGQCQLYMAMRADDFLTDRVRVGFVLSLLSGPAARWATPLLTQNNPLLDDYAAFCAQFRLMFEDPLKAQTACRRLKDLRQGKSSIQTYIQEFRLVSQDSTWNEAALMDAFQDGLSDELLDELARVDPPETFEALVLLCLRIDARLQQRRRRRARSAVPPFPAPSMAAPAPAEPMELGASRSRLSAEEKDRRRRLGLCLYCGGQGHFSATCPVKRRVVPVPLPGRSTPSGND